MDTMTVRTLTTATTLSDCIGQLFAARVFRRAEEEAVDEQTVK